jgi:hypothetical protein
MCEWDFQRLRRLEAVNMPKCEVCGKKVKCPEHGAEHIVKDYALDGLVFYYCVKCVEEHETAFGAVVHDHFIEVLAEFAKQIDPHIKVGKVGEA